MSHSWLIAIPIWPLIGLFTGAPFIDYLSRKGLIKTTRPEYVHRADRFLFELYLVPIALPICLILDTLKFVYRRVAPVLSLFRVFRFNSIGDVSMKRKLFVAMFYLATGMFAPNIWEYAKDWWKAPPAPAGSEASSLISSLNDSTGWQVGRRENEVWLSKGHVSVRPCRWHADVQVNSADANAHFSNTDLGGINDAAKQCLRKLTVKEMATDISAGSVIDDGTSYLVQTNNGSVYKIKK